MLTHERSFEKVLGEENLIGGVNFSAILDQTPLDRHDIVDGGHHEQEHSPGDGFHDDWAAAALEAVQPHYHQLPQRSLEHEHHDQRHLREYQAE